MNAAYLRATSLPEARQWLHAHPGARLLAGGQSLLPALRLGLAEATHLIDVQDLPELHALTLREDGLFIGAACTHAAISRAALVREHQPWLSRMAAHIADPQVREMGTLGGSLANADPAACWPAAVLAAGACIHTTHRTLGADDFFQGLFSTALQRDELIIGVAFPPLVAATYQKLEHPASRFAQPGVAVTRDGAGQVRVAITGLGQGVLRWPQAEQALRADFSPAALSSLALSPACASDDVHASAAYKAHLAGVLCRRILAELTQQAHVPQRATAAPVSAHAPDEGEAVLSGERVIDCDAQALWDLLLDPAVLQACVPGCERLVRVDATHYAATLQVGIGLVSARFAAEVEVEPVRAPTDPQGGWMRLRVSGQAGALGGGRANASLMLRTTEPGRTHLRWQAQPHLQGRLAQIGQRFVQPLAQQLSQQFLDALQARATGQPVAAPSAGWWNTVQRWWGAWRALWINRR